MRKKKKKHEEPGSEPGETVTKILEKTPEDREKLIADAKKKIEDTQEAMIERHGKTSKLSPIPTGSYVMLHNKEPKNKYEARNFGPYQLIGFEVTPRENALLVNPFVGRDSEFSAHPSDLTVWKKFNATEVTRQLAPQKDLQINGNDKTREDRIAYVKNYLQKENLSYLDLIGKRVCVNFGKIGKLYWTGTVIDFEPLINKHWIKYDVPSKDGTQCYPQNLLGKRPALWRFAEPYESDRVNFSQGGGVKKTHNHASE
jgi:hypothetical protein